MCDLSHSSLTLLLLSVYKPFLNQNLKNNVPIFEVKHHDNLMSVSGSLLLNCEHNHKYSPYSSANPFIGTRDVPVTNWSNLILFSESIIKTAYV